MFYEIKLKVEKENSKGEMKEVVEHFITDVGLFAEAEANGSDYQKLMELGAQKDELNERLLEKYGEWEDISDE